MIRAACAVVKVPGVTAPYDTIYLKVYYPAQTGVDERSEAYLMGEFPPSRKNMPVVIFFPGINVGTESYQWFAETLAAQGIAVVLHSWITEAMPGLISLTSGIDLKKTIPGVYGTAPTAMSLAPILDQITKMNTRGVLTGALDLSRVVLAGHSAGGSLALQNADPAYFPNVIGAFSYAAHNVAFTQLGYPPGTILPLPSKVPTLLIGGTCDGVIAASRFRYGDEDNVREDEYNPIERTYHEAITGGAGYLVMIDGANHFSITYPVDSTTGRLFLDSPTTRPDIEIRRAIVDVSTRFIRSVCSGESFNVPRSELIPVFERKAVQ
jgi:dienelactone hydrolase